MSQNYPYYLLEKIIMQGGNGLSLKSMSWDELEEAKSLEENGFINKLVKRDSKGKYMVYKINEKKFDFMGWNYNLGMDV